MSNTPKYINTVVKASQVSPVQKGEKVDYHFIKLFSSEDQIAMKADSFTIIVPEFSIKGAVISNDPKKVYSLDKDEKDVIKPFSPMVFEDSKKISGEHVIANISLKEPADPEMKFKVIANRKTLDAKGEPVYEQEEFETSFNTVSKLFIGNMRAISENIRAKKLTKAADNFVKVEKKEVLEKEPEITR